MPDRTIAVGDIHGCSQALAALLTAIRPRPDDRLVILGDYIDRGPDSRGVIEQLLVLREQCQLVTLLGNHEQMLLRCLESTAERRFWLKYGGRETLASYGGSLDAIPPRHLQFLRDGRLFFETAHHIFVHANYVADLPLDQQPEAVLLWTHLPRLRPAPHPSGKTVIVGHTPQSLGKILDWGYLMCIDTCCFGGGVLTALEVETKQVWQADAAGTLCRADA